MLLKWTQRLTIIFLMIFIPALWISNPIREKVIVLDDFKYSNTNQWQEILCPNNIWILTENNGYQELYSQEEHLIAAKIKDNSIMIIENDSIHIYNNINYLLDYDF